MTDFDKTNELVPIEVERQKIADLDFSWLSVKDISHFVFSGRYLEQSSHWGNFNLESDSLVGSTNDRRVE